MAVGLAAANGRHLTVRGALAFGASRAPLVLLLAAYIVARLLVGLLPFAAAVGVVYWTLLRHHDINFYLSQRPPEFWTAVSIAAVIVAALAVILLWTIARWTMALPLVLFEGVSPRRALAESSARSAGHRSIAIAALAMWAALASALLAVATWVPDFIGRALAPDFSGSMQTLLGFITGLVLLWAGLGLVTAVVNVSMLSLVLLRLYLRVVDLREPGALQELGADSWGGARRLPHTMRIGLVVVSILATLGAVLVVGNLARRNQQVLVIAHRGASAAAPENTLAAFRLGADLGAEFVELDVQESEDGEVVVVHDSDLMKVGGSPLKIWEAPAAALRGSTSAPQGAAVASERVPTLAEVFALCKGRVRVVVELKSYGHSQRLEERVVEIVEAAGVANDTIFMSLDHDMIRRLKQLRPSWRVGVLVAKAIGDLTSLGADFLAVEASLATRGFVRRAHGAGQTSTCGPSTTRLDARVDGQRRRRVDHGPSGRRARSGRTPRKDERCAAHSRRAPRCDGREDRVARCREAVQPYARRPDRAARRHLPSGHPAVGGVLHLGRARDGGANGVGGPVEGPYLAGQPLRACRAWCRPATPRGWRWPTTDMEPVRIRRISSWSSTGSIRAGAMPPGRASWPPQSSATPIVESRGPSCAIRRQARRCRRSHSTCCRPRRLRAAATRPRGS
jgi:glycerophosphoryl diester phosphodiesterase